MMTAQFHGDETARLAGLQAGSAYRLTAKVLEAFELACDLDDLSTAEAMLKAADDIMEREGVLAFRREGAAQNLVDAHFRLWEMRYLGRQGEQKVLGGPDF